MGLRATVSRNPRVRGFLPLFVFVLSSACSSSPPADECSELDKDGDGFVPAGRTFVCCDPEQICSADCNDDDPAIRPSGISDETQVEDEPGNGIDENCDGVDGVFGVDG
jgi:hypothetical protein